MPRITMNNLLTALLMLTAAGAAQASPAALCDQAAAHAAQRHSVPLPLMLAITRAETGREQDGGLQPWPWAVNLGGEGHWPDDRTKAAELAQTALDEGRLNIDIGCFQLNIRWHSKGFTALDEMLDPESNADYAARFLRTLYRETGDWAAAAGAYHSRNPDLAAAYAARVAELAGGMPAAGVTTGEAPPPDRAPNNFPLLQAGLTAGNGSLVPLTGAGPRLPGAGS
jgi:hypothetical protein